MMTEDELCELFELVAISRFAEAVAILVDHGQHLAALLVQTPVRHREIIAALDAQVVAGELDPVMVGAVIWVKTPHASLKYLEPDSPIWRGVPTIACSNPERTGPPPDQSAVAACMRAFTFTCSAKTPTDALECLLLPLTRTSGLKPDTVDQTLNILSTDVLEYPYALVIVIHLALGQLRMPVSDLARTQCAEALARARGAPPPRLTLVLPAVII